MNKYNLQRLFCCGVLGLSLVGFSAITIASSEAEQARLARGKAAAAVCAACHQADGNGLAQAGESAWPRLAGLDATYLEKQLVAFQTGDRVSPEMEPFATMLNAEQIKDVSAYFSHLPAKASGRSAQVTDEQLLRGKQLALSGDWNKYIAACSSCHGPGNQGVGAAFPDIAGQHPAYISAQLHAWRDGTRTGDPLGLMAAVSERLDDADIEAVAAWLGTQAPARMDASIAD